MSGITSASTIDQVEAAYIDNASYAEEGSVAKARAFVTACRVLLLKMPKETGSRDSRLTLNPELIHQEMSLAQDWINASDSGASSSQAGGPNVSRMSFEEFR